MNNVINLAQQTNIQFDKVKCEQLIESVAIQALQSMCYEITPMSQMRECIDKSLGKVA